MIKSFLDSIRYSGYLYPLAIFRIYLGGLYITNWSFKWESSYLTQPILAAEIAEWLPMSTSPIWFQEILESIVIPNWKIFAFISTYGELVIGTSLILGFLLRPVMIFAIIMLTVSTYATGTPEVNFFQVKFAVLLTMFAMGGGRCLGLDYHFFKSRRGFWW